jgi:hypothetical protein
MVGELKKGRYVYYHCTGSRGRCGDPYIREERLLQDLVGGFNQLVVAPATLCWLERSVTQSDKTETGAREQALKRLKAEYGRLQARIETMYLDRLDGRITAEFFDAKIETVARSAEGDRDAHEAGRDHGAEDGHGGGGDHAVPERRLQHIRGPDVAAAEGARVGPAAAGDLEGREVRDDPERTVSDFGALELCKPKQGKEETWFRAGN